MANEPVFLNEDFRVFTIDGLDERMEAIRNQIQPKFQAIADNITPALTNLTGEEMHAHIAKHARRKVNPPNDTWIAFADNSRGYKKLPHFQVGLFEDHLFIWFAMIYESPAKQDFASKLLQDPEYYMNLIPESFVWSVDHTKPEADLHGSLEKGDFVHKLERLQTVKKAELLCGVHLAYDDDRLQDPDKLLSTIEDTFETVLPLYETAKEAYGEATS
ncbi:uncharacterized protein YktB (UPF0637 family) [Salsuginibacillus halophilus]|uniref:UPF0637 protein B0H94_102118 n=1 Tax=Salsuginibacillus halophilus TaxID=517424 RepID=A0A2P8HXA1_9BACI|nr:DUF1054 domain-containing protein [Salsuginibacillus halophilus]PSL50842.1 uncharacterized protein YktB (UPF0637 family) [Salsuginibacillus halophilus]